MAETHLVYELEGEINEVDVFKLAPTLLALGQLIQESNHELFPEGQDIGVNVKPFRQGSFIVDLALFSPTNLQKLIEFLKPHTLEQLKTLLECIGLIAGGTTATSIGVIRAIRMLKGRPKSVEAVAPDQVRYTPKEGNSFTVKSEVHNLLSNPIIVQNIVNIYSPMEENQRILDVKTFVQGEEEATRISVNRNEIPAMKEYADEVKSLSEAETVKEVTIPGVLLNPKRGAFENDPKDWSFRRGEDIITATIKDQNFLAKYSAGIIRLNSSDLLTVVLLEKQKVKGTIVQKPSYEIIRVTEYKQGPTQRKLI